MRREKDCFGKKKASEPEWEVQLRWNDSEERECEEGKIVIIGRGGLKMMKIRTSQAIDNQIDVLKFRRVKNRGFKNLSSEPQKHLQSGPGCPGELIPIPISIPPPRLGCSDPKSRLRTWQPISHHAPPLTDDSPLSPEPGRGRESWRAILRKCYGTGRGSSYHTSCDRRPVEFLQMCESELLLRDQPWTRLLRFPIQEL